MHGFGSRGPLGYAAVLPPHPMSIVLTEFARPRLFPRGGRGNAIQDCTPQQFQDRLNAEAPLKVLDGYAPFCKLHVHRNWTSTRCLTVPVTDDNRHQLRSGYEARNAAELPVLVRWFEGVEPPVAAYFVVILYSREQLAREGSPIEADWGIVGCIYTAEPDEVPMARRSPCCVMPWVWRRAAPAYRWIARLTGAAWRSGSATRTGGRRAGAGPSSARLAGFPARTLGGRFGHRRFLHG